MNTETIMSSGKQIIDKPDKNLSVIVDEIVQLDNRNIDYHLKNFNVTSREIYNWLLNNQNNLNCIVLLGEFNQLGIETCINKQKAFELYQKAANLGYALGMNNLGYCYQEGIGTNIDNKKAFELYQKAANLGNSIAQHNLDNMMRGRSSVIFSEFKSLRILKFSYIRKILTKDPPPTLGNP